MGRATTTAAGLLAVLWAGPALAQTGGTIQLTSVVSTRCVLSVTDASLMLNITGGETAREVASITETCNAKNYSVTLSSLNRGRLVTGTNASVAYSVSYDGQASTLSSPLVLTRDTRSRDGRTASLLLTLPATPLALSGSYADTITVSIVAQ